MYKCIIEFSSRLEDVDLFGPTMTFSFPFLLKGTMTFSYSIVFCVLTFEVLNNVKTCVLRGYWPWSRTAG